MENLILRTMTLLFDAGNLVKRAYNVSMETWVAWQDSIDLASFSFEKEQPAVSDYAKAICKFIWCQLTEVEQKEDGSNVPYATLKDKKNEKRKGHQMALGMFNLERWLTKELVNIYPDVFGKEKADTAPKAYSEELQEAILDNEENTTAVETVQAAASMDVWQALEVIAGILGDNNKQLLAVRKAVETAIKG
jgi:hypothetical protein